MTTTETGATLPNPQGHPGAGLQYGAQVSEPGWSVWALCPRERLAGASSSLGDTGLRRVD